MSPHISKYLLGGKSSPAEDRRVRSIRALEPLGHIGCDQPWVGDPNRLHRANDMQDCDFYKSNSESHVFSIRLTTVLEIECVEEHHIEPDDVMRMLATCLDHILLRSKSIF